MVVGMDGLLAAQLAAEGFDRPVGDHLVDVHVGLGAGAGLPDPQGELAIELALGHPIGGHHNRRG